MFDPNVFGPPEPAPHVPGQGKPRTHSVPQIILLVAAWVLTMCLRRKAFTAHEAWQAIPELRDKHAVANSVATAMGAGVGGRGFRLWRGPNGHFAAVKENAVLAVHRLGEAELQEVARSLGLPNLEALAQAILALPSIRPAPPGSAAPLTAVPDQPSPTPAAAAAGPLQPA
jgi:hypothetical protein